MSRVPAELRVEMVAIDDVRPLEVNPRRGDVERIRASVRRFGQYAPLVVRAETSEVLKGNHTWHALKEEGVARIAVTRRSVPDDDEAQRLALTDNTTSDAADWDVPMLVDVLGELAKTDIGLEGTGFEDAHLVSFIAQAAALRAPDPNEVEEPAPEPPKNPKTRPGDLIQLGRHRLMCGSSINEKDVAKLLGETAPLLIHTDPPYGVELDGSWRDDAGYNSQRFIGAKDHRARAVAGAKTTHAAEASYTTRDATDKATKGDSIVDWSAAYALCPSALVAYVWHADRWTDVVLHGLESIGFERVQMLIWDKEIFVLSRSMYHWQHEPAWIARRKGARVPWHGSKDQATIIRAPSPKRIGQNHVAAAEGKWEHPTQKPLATAMPSIANHLLPGEFVYDPFAGSGTTLIAAEHLDRGCVAMEVDPGYCDVIVERWEQLTGEKAKRPTRKRASSRKATGRSKAK